MNIVRTTFYQDGPLRLVPWEIQWFSWSSIMGIFDECVNTMNQNSTLFFTNKVSIPGVGSCISSRYFDQSDQ